MVGPLQCPFPASAGLRPALECISASQCQPLAGTPVPSVGPEGRPGAPLASAGCTVCIVDFNSAAAASATFAASRCNSASNCASVIGALLPRSSYAIDLTAAVLCCVVGMGATLPSTPSGFKICSLLHTNLEMPDSVPFLSANTLRRAGKLCQMRVVGGSNGSTRVSTRHSPAGAPHSSIRRSSAL